MAKQPLQDILDNIHDTLAELSGETYNSVWNGSAINTDWYANNAGAATYSISTAAELAGLAQLVNSGTSNFSGKTIVLSANIDLNSMPWTPIGTNNYSFYGNFEGNGHLIGNLKIEGDVQYAGLFGYTYNNSGESTCIRNVHLRNVNINVNGSGANSVYAGGIVGYQGGNGNQAVNNCSAKGDVSASGSSSAYAGGIAGYQSGSGNQAVNNCSAKGDVSASGSSSAYAGGIAGYQNGGGNIGIRIMNCYFIGNLINPSNPDNSYAGGILGYWSGSNTGGGYRCNFIDCYAATTFSGFSVYGNLLGGNDNDPSYLIVTDCYYDRTLAGFNDGTGIGATTERMRTQCTYFNWDFGYVWRIEPDRYPELRIFDK